MTNDGFSSNSNGQSYDARFDGKTIHVRGTSMPANRTVRFTMDKVQ